MNNITVPNGTENKIRSKAQAWLIISQLIAGFFFICWGALALAAAIIGWPMVIETEGGWDFLAITFSLMLCYPLYAIIPPIVAWILYARRQYKFAVITSVLPLLIFLLTVFLYLVADISD